MKNQQNRLFWFPILQIIAAAALFGASVPLAKLLLGDIAPVPLAGFLYIGSGMGMLLWRVLFKADQGSCREAKIVKQDWPWLIGAISSGGIAAPIVLMVSLKQAPASTAALLLNFEGVATTIIAGIVFKEHIGKRIWGAVLLIAVASIALSWNTSGQWGFSLSAVGVLAACGLWGADNNFTRNISAKDPYMIVAIKGSCAGIFSLLLAQIIGQPFPHLSYAVMAMFLGCLSYGCSIVFFIQGMRELGSARTSALYGIAPFLGAVLSIALYREVPEIQFIVAMPVMILGAILLLKEDHVHWHRHHYTEHEHRHCHSDGHHTHSHQGDTKLEKNYHSHVHQHEETEHWHGHTPNIHHRHSH
ncbi:EamA family transporter [Dehalobacter sp. DCM]|uniref:DMT family transporter n=1 Tax=Dehalobacter sp. DCM TaxID=2907827 RepID=UPI0030821720|nr:EamA family transporter [Dehalobacter sp. DCM]